MAALNVQTLTETQLAATVDFALLRADATTAEFETLCATADSYGFAIVAINPEPVALCARILADSPVGVGAAIAFPLGAETPAQKERQTELALADGATEIDYVVNLRAVKDGDHALIEQEMSLIVAACRQAGAVSKVILEACYLTDPEKRLIAEVARTVRPDFVKTSTGFGSGGATLADVALLRDVVKGEVALKASTGIRTLSDAIGFIAAGCTRLGTSAGPAIVDEFRQQSDEAPHHEHESREQRSKA